MTHFLGLQFIELLKVATKAYIANGKDGFEMFNDPSVEKQPCSCEEELDNLPVLKYSIVERLKGTRKTPIFPNEF